ncbi:MAG: radical SAM family heme chaperone HemW [Nibricoccus sp.]
MSEIASASRSDQSANPLGLYVHVPFCASTCDFCAFYQEKPTGDSVDRYMAGIAREAALVDWGTPVSTVFWGGGTPGLLAPDDMRRLGAVVRERAGNSVSEWTVEMAPASVTKARLAALKEIGVTRISMGVQSFQPALLEGLGRQHTREQIYRAHELIAGAAFKSVNLDLMFALPGQDEAAWLDDLAKAVALKPDHISTYCLTFEEDTKLWVKLSQGKVKLDAEREAQLYERTWAELDAAGYAQYEVSNFARPGHACQHNVNTWRMHSWVGLGPSAASQHAGWRGTNVADLEKWLAGLERGERATEDRTVLTPELLAEDSLIFGLRMNEGVDLGTLEKRVPAGAAREMTTLANRLVADDLATLESGRLRLTLRGRLVADAIGSEVMGALSAGI